MPVVGTSALAATEPTEAEIIALEVLDVLEEL
jgi:hypothetical protein